MRNTRTIEARVGVWLAGLLALLALPIAMLAAPVTAQAAGKVSVAMSVEVAAAPADVWKTIGGFDRLQDWHPAVESTTMNGSPTTPGSSRVLHLKGGGEIHETLTSYSDSLMRYTYKIDQSPLPVADYRVLSCRHRDRKRSLAGDLGLDLRSRGRRGRQESQVGDLGHLSGRLRYADEEVRRRRHGEAA